ncbi:MAG TPA: DUF2007 domain-containing protein [Longimicrobiaceae bacterium]|nr:DUF2007 domain-containing protein [Longimicrobiaceae bacterium]
MFDSIPEHYRQGVAYLVVSREAVPHPEVPGVFVLGECATGEYDPGVDSPVQFRSGVHLYHGSFVQLARQEDGFDWEGELWETIAHEVLHHRESMAGEDALEEMDYAEDENFKRREGQPFDPLFYRSGEPAGESAWEVDGDLFIERELDPGAFAGMTEIEVEVEGEPLAVPRPDALGDVHYVYLDGLYEEDDAGEVALVLVRRRGAWESVRGLFGGRRAPEVLESSVLFGEEGEDEGPRSRPLRQAPGGTGPLVEVKTYGDELNASVARDILAQAGIPAEVRVDGGSGAYAGVFGRVRGWRLAVPTAAVDEALALLADGDPPPAPEEDPRP